MSGAMLRFVRTVGTIVLAALMLLFGYVISAAGYQTLRTWPAASVGYSAVGLLWVVLGPAMLAAGLWVLGSQGRSRIPLWIGGGAALLAGSSLIAGVLTYVIPCSGPS